MKKKFFILSVILFLGGIIFYENNTHEISAESEIKIANIEALVNDEGQREMSCFKTRIGTSTKRFELYCKKCSYMFADSFEGNGTCLR